MEEENFLIDDSIDLEFIEEIENMELPPLTDEYMLEVTLEHQKEDSYDDFIKYFILHLLNPRLRFYEQWKDFFIRHGYINEKEEIIYKPEDNK